MLLILKAQIKGAHTPDLFATPVHVAAHVAHGHVVGPYIAIRHKAPPEISHPKAVILHAHAPLAAQIARDVEHVDAKIAEYKTKQAVEAGRGPGNNAAVYDPMIEQKEKDRADLAGILAHIAPPEPTAPTIITTMPEVDIKAEAQRKAQAKKLRDAADKIIAAGEESLGRDRQANTRKRVQEAASAIDSAQKEIQLGETMRNLAAAIESGDAVALSSITSRAAVEQLGEQLSAARTAHWRKKDSGKPTGESHRGWEEMHRRPVNAEDIAHANLPVPRLYSHTTKDLVEAARILEIPGHDATVKWLEGVDYDDGVAPSAEQMDQLRALMGDLEKPLRWHREHGHSEHYTKRNAARAGQWAVTKVREMMTAHNRFAKMGITSDEQLRAALTEFVQHRTGKRAEDPIKAAERALVGTRPGIDFFPTPPPLAQRMVQLANINPGEHVLEPSAGKGDIADAVRAAGGKVDAVELSDTLRKVIEAKGHKLVGTDFEAFDSHEQYDAIVMNPPWSGGADVRHVMRAFGMLKPGGRLVALMSMHPSFAQDKASVAFRAWMDSMDGEAEKIPASDFASQWMSGGIPSWLIRVDKPMTKALFLKATIKGANTGDLFGQPVYVHPYVREGHTVQGHTEIRQVHHEAPPAPKRESWHIIGDYVTALLAGEPGDIEAAAAALNVGTTHGLADHQINRLRSFLEGKMPNAAIGRIATKVGMTLPDWVAAVRAEHFKPKAVVVNRGAVPAALSDAAVSARAARDRAQAEYQSSREWAKTDPNVRNIGGIAASKQREAGDRHRYHAAVDRVRAADAAIANRQNSDKTPTAESKPAADTEHERMVEAQWQALLARGAAQEKEAQRLADLGKPQRFRHRTAKHLTFLVSPEMHEGHAPGSWRSTTFDERGPVGHTEHYTAKEAFLERVRDSDLVEAKPVIITRPEAKSPMANSDRCAVIDGIIAAKGSKPAMVKLVADAVKAGRSAFLGNSPSKMVGDSWDGATNPSEPDHITQGRTTLARYKEQIANREKRGLGGGLSTASDEQSYKLWEARLAADPSKWSTGMGVSYQVASGRRGMQTNRGFRIASIDVAGKRAVLRQVADTGMTSSGGDHDRFEDSYVYLGELKRDKKHDAPIPVITGGKAA